MDQAQVSAVKRKLEEVERLLRRAKNECDCDAESYILRALRETEDAIRLVR